MANVFVMDPKEISILLTYVPVTWYQWTVVAISGFVVITAILAITLLVFRKLLECCVERPGKNRLSLFATCKKVDGKWKCHPSGCRESLCWSFLTFLFFLEGFMVYMFAVALSAYAITAAALLYINIAIPMVIMTVLVAIAVTHSCRERNLMNYIWGKEIDVKTFEDFNEENCPVSDDVDGGGDGIVGLNGIQEVTEHGEVNTDLPGDYTPVIQKQNLWQATVGNYFDALRLGLKKKLIIYLIMMVLCVLATAIIVMFTNRLCICIYPTDVSSQLSRLIRSSYDPSCPMDGVCYSYVLLPNDPSSEMIVKFHTRSKPFSNAYLFYDTVSYNGSTLTIPSTNYLNVVSCTTIDASEYTSEEFKYIHTCDLSGLAPSTTYHFTTVYDRANATDLVYPFEKKFKTTHAGTAPMTFVVGGDKTLNDAARVLYRLAAARDPAFMVIGGDLVYANSFSGCFRRWDDFFKEYSTYMISPDGHSIPLLTCPGNHEADSALFNQPKVSARDYANYFSHELNKTGLDRNFYHIHKLGSYATLISLDSGVVTSYTENANFMKAQFNHADYVNRKKFALYHAPLYPSARLSSNTQALLGRAMWGPIFDTYNVLVGMENHDHAMKRTKKIRDGNWNNNVGTTYIGDGSFGTHRHDDSGETKPYMEKYKESYHLWSAIITPVTTLYEAFDTNNDIIDSFTLAE